MWLFIVADLMMFLVFFALFAAGQAKSPEVYQASRSELNYTLGFINTLILLLSGWLVARAVQDGYDGALEVARKRLLTGIFVGLGFAVVKMYEYWQKISENIYLTTNDFYMYYYCLTGIHFLHFVVGIILLWIAAAKLSEGRKSIAMPWLECAAIYWHMVDLLWIVLFPMFYLAGGIE